MHMTLPVHIPQDIGNSRDATTDSLRITPHQYVTAQKESDLAEVLSQQMDFGCADLFRVS